MLRNKEAEIKELENNKKEIENSMKKINRKLLDELKDKINQISA